MKTSRVCDPALFVGPYPTHARTTLLETEDECDAIYTVKVIATENAKPDFGHF